MQEMTYHLVHKLFRQRISEYMLDEYCEKIGARMLSYACNDGRLLDISFHCRSVTPLRSTNYGTMSLNYRPFTFGGLVGVYQMA